MPKSQLTVIDDLQNNPDYVILNNPLSALKFVRKLGLKTEQTLTEVYTPKLFYEIITRLRPEHLVGVSKEQNITLTINVKDFLNSVDTGKSRNLYNHILDCADRLQTTQVKWVENACEVGTTIISYYKHHPKTNEIEVQVHSELVKKVLELTHSAHFSFLKKYLYKLNNAQAIKLFPFFISWRNKGMVEMTLDMFKKRFGCETVGYKKFSNLKMYVLDPALSEINDKTDLQISYKLLGTSLTSAKPRITGVQFFIKEKAKQQQLPQPTAAQFTEFEEIKTPKPTAPVVKSTPSQPDNLYLAEILRVFCVFEPDSTPENIGIFLTYFDNQKAVLEACLYAEQEQVKGRVINNFRGYLVSGIPKGLGSGILEQRTKDQAKAQQVEQKKTNQADKAAELENLLKEAQILRGGYRTEMDTLLQNTPTNDKENVAAILRKKRVTYASRTLKEFESTMFIADYLDTFIATYPERFGEVHNTYKKASDVLAAKIKKLDPTKVKNLFYY
jgi:plasmid replication initiation protein